MVTLSTQAGSPLTMGTMNESPAVSLASSLAAKGIRTQEQITEVLRKLPPTDIAQLEYYWPFWARPNQLPPDGDWRFWLILTGRGWGKTRTGAEWVRSRVKESPLVNLIGATADDARDIMIEGESGILAICPSSERPQYMKAERKLIWPNGAKSLIFTADEPERLRGKQHTDLWGDELAAWRYQQAFDQAMFGLRLGRNPRAVFTTTPKPVQSIRILVKDGNCVVTRGTTYENRPNLAPAFYQDVIGRYEGTRLGRQELGGEILDDVPGALWSRSMIDNLRVTEAPEMRRVVVSIDPAVTSGEDADETGIIAVGKGYDGHGYVLKDVSGRFTPQTWAQRALYTYEEYGADRIVAEVNNGGDMVESTLRTVDARVSYKAVHASRGKRVRAEPIAALYEQGRVHHVGAFPELEDQMANYTPDGYDGSPDRLDALVWALTELDLVGSMWVVA